MAIIFPKGIYSEGQGIFDPMPYIKYMDAKKKARAEAVTKANDDLYKQMNTAGARNQDLEVPADVIINGQVVARKGDGITKNIKDWVAKGIANRDLIAKGGMAKIEYENEARSILNDIQNSHNEKENEAKIADYYFNNKIEHTDDDMEKRNRITYSIYDPRHYKENFKDPTYIDKRGTSFGLNDFSQAIEPYTTKDKTDLYDYSIKGATPTIDQSVPPKRVGDINIYKARYADDVLRKGSETAANEVHDASNMDVDNQRKRKTYQNLMEDPAWMAQALPILQKYYPGKTIETVKDAVQADFLKQYSQKEIEVTHPVKASTNVRVNTGGSKDLPINPVWPSIKDAPLLGNRMGKKYILMNSLTADARERVLKLVGDNSISANDLYIYPNSVGDYELYQVGDDNEPDFDAKNRITILDEKSVDYGAQPTAKQKTAVAQKAQAKKAKKTTDDPNKPIF